MATSRTSPPDSGADRPGPAHVILVGLPGAGKSAVGALLAKALDRPFLDFDAEIVRREQMSISAIFGRRGEAAFRALEHALTEELRSRGAMVLAPGGGWITRPDTVALLRPPSRLVYLDVTPATAMRRMGSGARKRPLLLRPDPVAELGRLLDARRGAYETADVVVSVEGLTAQQVTARIMEALP